MLRVSNVSNISNVCLGVEKTQALNFNYQIYMWKHLLECLKRLGKNRYGDILSDSLIELDIMRSQEESYYYSQVTGISYKEFLFPINVLILSCPMGCVGGHYALKNAREIVLRVVYRQWGMDLSYMGRICIKLF